MKSTIRAIIFITGTLWAITSSLQAQTIESVMRALQERHMAVETSKYVKLICDATDIETGEITSEVTLMPIPIDWGMDISPYPTEGELSELELDELLDVLSVVRAEYNKLIDMYYFPANPHDFDGSVAGALNLGQLDHQGVINEYNLASSLMDLGNNINQMKFLAWPARIQYLGAGFDTYDYILDDHDDDTDEIGDVIDGMSRPSTYTFAGYEFDEWHGSHASSETNSSAGGALELSLEGQLIEPYYNFNVAPRHWGFLIYNGELQGNIYLLGMQMPTISAKLSIGGLEGEWPEAYEEFKGYRVYKSFNSSEGSQFRYGWSHYNEGLGFFSRPAEQNLALGDFAEFTYSGNWHRSSAQYYKVSESEESEEYEDNGFILYDLVYRFFFGESEFTTIGLPLEELDDHFAYLTYAPVVHGLSSLLYHWTETRILMEPQFKYYVDVAAGVLSSPAPVSTGQLIFDSESTPKVFLDIGRGLNGERGYLSFSKKSFGEGGEGQILTCSLPINPGGFDVLYDIDPTDMPGKSPTGAINDDGLLWFYQNPRIMKVTGNDIYATLEYVGDKYNEIKIELFLKNGTRFNTIDVVANGYTMAYSDKINRIFQRDTVGTISSVEGPGVVEYSQSSDQFVTKINGREVRKTDFGSGMIVYNSKAPISLSYQRDRTVKSGDVTRNITYHNEIDDDFLIGSYVSSIDGPHGFTQTFDDYGRFTSRIEQSMGSTLETTVTTSGNSVSSEVKWSGSVISQSQQVWNGGLTGYTVTDGEGLETTVEYYGGDEGVLPWAVKSITYPDGRTTNYSYSYSGDELTATVTTGPVETVTVTNKQGHLVSSTTTEAGVTVYRITGSSYDDWGRPTVLTFLDNTTVERTYAPDFRNRILTETDRNGITQTYSYDGLGRLIGVASDVDVDISYDGFTTTATYSAGGDSYKVGRTTNGFGDLLTAYNEFEPATSTSVNDFVYTTKNLQTKETTVVTTHADGSIKSIGGTSVEAVKFDYGVADGETYVKRSLEASGGNIYDTTYFDAIGRVSKLESPSASGGGMAVTEFRYNSTTGRLEETESPDGIVTSFGYDSSTGRMNSIAQGDQTLQVDVGYANGERTVTTSLNQQEIRKVATNVSSLQSTITPLGRMELNTVITPNFGARSISVTSPYGSSTLDYTDDWALDAISTTIGGMSGTTNYQLDGFNRLTGIESDFGGIESSASFYKNGLVDTTTSRGHTTNFSYSNNYKNVTGDTLRGMFSIETDSKGNLTALSAPGVPSIAMKTKVNSSGVDQQLTTTGATTEWKFNTGGAFENKEYANNSGPSLESSAAGRPELLTTARDVDVKFNYKPGTNEIQNITYSDGTPGVALGVRNALGLPSTLTDGSGERTLVYKDALLEDEVWASGVLGGVTIDRNYDSLYRLTGLSVTRGSKQLATVGYSYSGNGTLLQGLSYNGNTVTYGYTGAGQIDTTNYNSSILSVDREWDGPELDSIKSDADDSFDFDVIYNNKGEIYDVDMGPGRNWNYTYSNAQLIEGTLENDDAVFCGSEFSYSINANGQRTGATWGSTQTGFTYGNNLNQATIQTHNGAADVVVKADPNATISVMSRDRLQPVAYKGTWVSATSASGFHGADYLHDDNTNKGKQWVDYFVRLMPGEYRLDMQWPADSTHASNVPVIVAVGAERSLHTVNQKINGAAWNELQSITVNIPTDISVRIGTVDTDGIVVADAVRFVDLGSEPEPNQVLDVSSADSYHLLATSSSGGYTCSVVSGVNTNGPVMLDVIIEGTLAQGGGADAVSEYNCQLVLPPAESTIGYDADGNRTADWRWNYVWDGAGRLITMEATLDSVAAGLPNYRLEFAYDAQGRRFKKSVYEHGQHLYTRYFVYDGWNLVAELDKNFDPVNTYAWGPDISSGGGAGGIGGLVAITSHEFNKTLFPVYNHRGDVIALVDAANGSTVAEYEYGPFGEPMRTPELASSSVADANHFRYSTKYTDPETSLVYFGYRYYDPIMGAWLSREPLGEGASPNLYAYCGNDPVNKVDYLGLADIDWNAVRAAPGNAWDWLVDAWRRPTAFDIFQKDTAQFYIGDPFIGSLKFINEKPVEIVRGLNSERQAIGNNESAQMGSLGIFTGFAELGVDILDYGTADELFPTFANWHENVDTFSSSIDSAHFSSGRFIGYEAPLVFLGPEMLLDDAVRGASYSIRSDIVSWEIINRGRALDEAERLYQLRLMRNRLALEYGQQSTLADSLYGATSTYAPGHRFVAMAGAWPQGFAMKPLGASKLLKFNCEVDALLIQESVGGKILNIKPPVPGANLGPIRPPGGGLIGFSEDAAGVWYSHTAVLKNGMVYDRMTGMYGFPFDEYQKLFEYFDDLIWSVSE